MEHDGCRETAEHKGNGEGLSDRGYTLRRTPKREQDAGRGLTAQAEANRRTALMD